MTTLNGKIAIVTGAAAGFGAAIATLYVQEGAKVILAEAVAVALAVPPTCSSIAFRTISSSLFGLIDFAASLEVLLALRRCSSFVLVIFSP
jgi:NAD(P)-dependent dehydrogenase (short-subunit alcohol dehydrogenase family)